MRQFAITTIKLIGLVSLLYTIYLAVSLIPVIIPDLMISYDYKFILIFASIPILASVFSFYICVYKTEWLLKILKFDIQVEKDIIDSSEFEEEKTNKSFSQEAISKIGIFLIGIYLLAVNAPNVIIRVTQWFTKEMSQVKGNSLEDLLNMVSPYNTDTLLYSLTYTIFGYLIAVYHSKIASHFFREKKDI